MVNTDKLTTESVSAAAKEALTWLGDHGFSYFNSYNQYRRKNENGFSYIGINSVTHDRQSYHLAFYLGVQITSVEELLHQIGGNDKKINHYDRTIWNYTVNIGPESPHWKYPVRGTWSICDLSDFLSRKGEIIAFIRDLGLPFVNDHRDPVAIRETLIKQPGHAQNLYPYQQILAIDKLYGSPDQVGVDISLLSDRYKRFAPQPRAEFDKFVVDFKSKCA